MRVLSAEQIQGADRHAIETLGIPGVVLMENAGLRVVEALEDRFPDLHELTVLVICGKGNNGGDGFVVARHLYALGVTVHTVLLADAKVVTGDALTNLNILKALGCHPTVVRGPKGWEAAAPFLDLADIVIDGIFGTGLTGRVKDWRSDIIEEINESDACVVSIDIPSGVVASEMEVPGSAIMADLTVTFACPKIAHLFSPAASYSGEIEVVDIGIPDMSIEAQAPDIRVSLDDDIRHLLERLGRYPDSHKGDFGRVIVLAGSRGKSGAAAMAGEAALRMGAGLVTVAAPSSALQGPIGMVPELMTEPLPETPEGTASAEALAIIESALENADVLAIGPGLGVHPEVRRLILELLPKLKIPVVIDADGVNNLAPLPDFGAVRVPVILTPHPGEMGRLLNKTATAVRQDRIAISRRFATDNGVYVVLKGEGTLIGEPDGELHLNPTGNPGMATAGSGDILTGILAGLLAQGLGVVDALRLGVYLHGAAGDLAAESVGEASLMATDLIDWLPDAIEMLADVEPEDLDHSYPGRNGSDR